MALGRKARFLPLAGLSLIAAFYIADLVAMFVLPDIIGSRRAMSFMTDLHLNWSWPVILLAISAFCIGYICSVSEASEVVERLERAEQSAQFAQHRMEDFAESASDWFWEMDAELRYVWCSSPIESVIGAPRETLYGRKREDLKESYKPNALWKAQLERLSKREPFKDFIYPRQGPDGVRWIRSSGVPVRDSNGEFAGYRGTGSDVTREVEAEAAADDAKTLLAQAFQGLDEGFALWGPDDRLVLCNEKFRQVNAVAQHVTEPGVLFSDYVRSLITKGAYPAAVGREKAWLQERLDFHRAPGSPYELLRQDGIWLLVDEQKLADGSTVTINLDITQRKQAEIALQESEALLASIFENVPLGLLIKDADHVIERVNDAYVRWYGLDVDALIGHELESVDGFLPGDDAATMRKQEAEVRTSGRILTRQVDRAFADGSMHTIRITKFPIRSRDGKVEKTGSISVDLTEQMMTQKALEESERRYRDFAESASDWSWEMDDQLRFSAVSDRFFDIMGFEPSGFLGKTRREMTQENIKDVKWQRHLDDLDNRRAFRDFRYDTERPGGGILTMSISGKPIFDETGVFQGYRGTGTNFTEQRRTEIARDVALQEALNANAAKSTFLANMSHDLRTPLNAILGFSDILREELLGPLGEKRYREYAGDIHSSASYLLDLVNDLLDISTIEAGKKSLVKENLSVQELIDDCVRVFVGKAYSKDVELTTEVPADLPPLFADKRATRQILVNLLANAVKFTPNGGSVTTLARMSEQNIEIVVKDTGRGIPEERLAEVISPFNRGEQNPYETDTGWGLGLSIVHSLVDLHGGKMDIQSALGDGTIVTITLPNQAS